MDGTRLTLYRLPEVIAGVRDGATVFVCEGEKDADRVRAEGYTATTNPMAAGKWHKVADEARQVLKDADVIVVQDRDEAGEQELERRHASLARGCP